MMGTLGNLSGEVAKLEDGLWSVDFTIKGEDELTISGTRSGAYENSSFGEGRKRTKYEKGTE